jgi:hypothetical protein
LIVSSLFITGTPISHRYRFLGNSPDRTLLLAPKDSTLDSPFFYEEVLNASSIRSENAAKFRKTRKPLTLIHMDNTRVHTARATQEKSDVSDSNARRNHRIARMLHHPTFLFNWLKTALERKEFNGEDELHEVVDEILTSLSIEMIETVFVD